MCAQARQLLCKEREREVVVVVVGGNLRAVINAAAAANPVQRRCIPAQATIQQRTHAGRQAQASAIHCTHILIQRSNEPRAWKEIPIIQAE